MKKMKLLKSILCAFAVAGTSAWVGASTYSVTVQYDGAMNTDTRVAVEYVTAGTGLTTVVYGVGAGGGGAHVIDYYTGETYCMTNAGGSSGQSFSSSNDGYVTAGKLLRITVGGSAASPGSYITSIAFVGW